MPPGRATPPTAPGPAGTPAVRGAARRAAIIEAALAVVARVGPDALTHRQVASEAGVPLAATTYWFASKEDIVEAAFLRATERDVEYLDEMRPRARTWTRATVAAELAGVIEAACDTGRERSLVGYALWIEALRRPALRPFAQRWTDAYVDFYADVLATIGTRGDVTAAAHLLAASVDGLVSAQLSSDAPLDRATLTRVLAPLFERGPS